MTCFVTSYPICPSGELANIVIAAPTSCVRLRQFGDSCPEELCCEMTILFAYLESVKIDDVMHVDSSGKFDMISIFYQLPLAENSYYTRISKQVQEGPYKIKDFDIT